MRLTNEERENLLRRGYGPGHRHFTCCPVCGFLEWRMTQKNEPDDVTVQEDAGRGCPKCQEVLHRDPEVFQWVLAVIGYRDRKATPQDHIATIQGVKFGPGMHPIGDARDR